MKRFSLLLTIALAGVLAAQAQQWEFGGSGGAGFLKGLPVTGVAGSATAGFKSGAAFGGFFGQNLYKHLSGELRYSYLQSDLRLTSGSAEATFKGVSHLVHYDLLFHTNKRNARAQLFVAAGGGMRLFRGTGKEAAYQPLQQYAIFTRTQVVKPMASVGGGVKFQIARNVYLRTEFRDYITIFPKDVITPAPGAKISGLLHDFVPLIGLSFTF
jgi:hypothetical protein